MPVIRNLRWWIAGLLALATALNYLDRQSFPVAVGAIRKEIPITDQQFGDLGSLFLLAYAIMYVGGGRIMDWLGVRRGYAVMIVWWSLANCLIGTVSSVLGLKVFRFLLGMGEGGGFPGSAKAVAEWFPPRERAMAFGLFNTGSAVGAVLAPPLIALIVSTLGWRWVFYLTGAAGIFWAWGWLAFYRPPAEHKMIGGEEREMIKSSVVLEQGARSEADGATMPWLSFFRIREVRGLMLAKFLTDGAWFFISFWLPKYLLDARGFDTKQIGYYAWIPYAFAGAGSLAAGFASSWLLRGNTSLDRTRKVILTVSAALLPSALFISSAPVQFAIILFSMLMFGHQCFSSIMQTIPADLFPSRVVGSVGGLMGGAGAFGGMISNAVAGRFIGDYGYGTAFLIAGLLHPLALVVIYLTVRRIAPLQTA